MADEKFQAEQPQTEAPRAEGPQSSKSSLAEELTRLGQNFSQLIRETLQSPQLQEIRKEVATGAQTVIEEVNEIIVKARESQVTQEVTQKAAATVEEIKTAPVTENIKVGVLNALKSVNEELSELIEKMDQNMQAARTSQPEAGQPGETVEADVVEAAAAEEAQAPTEPITTPPPAADAEEADIAAAEETTPPVADDATIS